MHMGKASDVLGASGVGTYEHWSLKQCITQSVSESSCVSD